MISWRQRIGDLLPKGRVARGIITLASGTAAAQAITICAMPIVTRLYTPAQVGVISLFLAFFNFWAATLSLRYEYALLIAKDDAESHVVHRLGLLLVLVMSILAMPVLFFLHKTAILGFGLLPNWAPIVAIPTLMGYGIFMVYRSWALRAGMVKTITKATIARSGANAGMQVLLGLLAFGIPGLFAAQVAGSWAAMLRLVRSVGRHFLPSRPTRIRRDELSRVARSYRKFPVFEIPSTWIDQLGLALPLPMVATLHGATAAGWFGLARMMVAIPNAQIGNAVADVFQMEFANAVVAGNKSRARSLFYNMLRKLALIGMLPTVTIAVLGPWLVPWVFGSEWREAGLAAACIAPWLYAGLIVSPLSRAVSVLQAQEYKLIYDASAVVLLVAAFIVSKSCEYSFIGTVFSISLAGLAGYVIYAAILIFVVEKKFQARPE